VEKALGAIRVEDVTTRLRRLVAEKVPSRQLAVAAAVSLLLMLAVFIFERGFTVGSGMRQRPVARPAETRSEAPVVPPAASIAPAPPTIATPVVPTRVAPLPAVVTQPAPAKPPAVVTQPAAVKSAPRAARSESSPKDEKASTPGAPPADQPIGLPRVSDYQPNPALRDIYFEFGTAAIRPGDL